MIIVGAGLAGASAARTLRAEGFTDDVTLLGSETYRPYLRPPLSKSYLSGQADRDAAFVEPAGWYAEHDVQFHPSADVVGVDRAEHLVHADGGRSYRYDQLLLATGASARLLPIPGSDRKGVHYLRTLDDADALRAELSAGGRRLVVIGSGWIGMEAGATARTLGNDVTILDRVFAAGDVASAWHPIAGIRIRNEHWANALNGGELAARAMLGADDVFDAIPYLYSDQFDLGMEFAGFAPLLDAARIAYRGEPGSREFIAFWLRDERVVAGMNINVWEVNDSIQALIRAAKPVDAARLTDPAIPLDQL